jgi:putative membrane protein
MMDWRGIPFIPFMWMWMVGVWFVFLIIAIFVYKDAENRGMNGLLWLILVILPWVGIIFLIIYLIIREEKGINSSSKSAEAIIEERYAKGEITREEYLKMKKDLSEKRREK